jgi:hypothetical protein
MDAFIEEACSPGRLGYNGDNVFDTAFKQVPTIHLPETQNPTLFGKRHSTGSAPSINNASPPTTSTTTNDLAVGNTPKRIRSGSLKAIRHYAALPFQQLTSNKECNTKGRSSGETVGPTLTVKRKHLSLPTAPYLLQLASPLLSHRQQYGGPRKKDDPSLWLCADLRRQFCLLSPSMEDIDPMDDDDDDDGTQAAMNEEIQKYFPMLGSDATVNAGKSTLLCETIP